MSRRTNLNLKAEFREYYLESFADRPAGIYDELEAAYIAGARAMAQDTLDTLGDYACAVSGCKTEVIKPEEVYDRAHSNLMVYYTKVLDNYDKIADKIDKIDKIDDKNKYSDIVSDGGMDSR